MRACRSRVFWWLAAACLALAACGRSANPSATPGGAGAPAPTASAQPAIHFGRSGGIAGVNESWDIYADGRVVDVKGREAHVPAGNVQTVLRQAEASGFYRLKLRATGPGSCRDCFTYWLTIDLTMNGSAKSNTVSFQGGDKGVPQSLWDLISSVQALLPSDH